MRRLPLALLAGATLVLAGLLAGAPRAAAGGAAPVRRETVVLALTGLG
jgi:hypothetical protein